MQYLICYTPRDNSFDLYRIAHIALAFQRMDQDWDPQKVLQIYWSLARLLIQTRRRLVSACRRPFGLDLECLTLFERLSQQRVGKQRNK